MTITNSNLLKPKKLPFNPKIQDKIKEIDDKVKNWKRLENMRAAALKEQQKKKERL